MNIYLIVILAALIGHYLINLISDRLNLANLRERPPEELADLYDGERYAKSQRYLRDNTRFGQIHSAFNLLVVLAMMLGGGFDLVDQWARAARGGPIATGLIFLGILMLASMLLQIPFSLYDTFVIEERYGFNKTTPKTFIADEIKSLLLAALLGVPVLAAVLWFFERAGGMAWIYCWIAVTIFQIFILFIAPVLILPLFNKFVPMKDGDLKDAIEEYAAAQNFKLKGVYTMDGSKRSSKSNAFFTGFGRFRRIVLFDTLIEKHTVDELVAVLAHEMGHYRKKHILMAIARSIATVGITLFILSLFMKNQGLFDAFRMSAEPTVYASLLFFGFLYTPIQFALAVVENWISRRQEYQADRYAVETYHRPQAFIDALKKLSADNLSNLSPHPFKVALEYSHPPVLDRIRAIKRSPLAGG
jgi:STE24 endopeptidase